MAYQPNEHIISKGARFVPGRRKYDKEKVRIIRSQMAARKSGRDGVSDSQYQAILGKLQAAGHMKINGFKGFSVDKELLEPVVGVPNTETTHQHHTIKFTNGINNQMKGDRPHITGYLTSVSEIDKEYKLKGWFNEDGTIRILITN
jgi:hypothetical protein